MENIENLAQLEAAVDKLLTAINEIKQEKILLEDRLAGRDQEIVKLKEQLQVLQSERSQIGQRVNSLLSSIDKWEKSNETVAVAEESGMKEKTLF
jgi:prefoldin subunit 5